MTDQLLLIPILISALVLLAINYFLIARNIRTMWLGVTLILFFINATGAVAYLLFILAPYITTIPVSIFSGIILIIVGLFNFILIFYFVLNGIKMIKKEGFSFANILPLLLVVLLIANEIINAMDFHNFFLAQFRYFILATASFFNTMLLIFSVACLSFFNRSTHKKIDYIIVHGAGLIDNKITPLLASRVDAAIAIFKQNKRMPKIIMSGGIGKGKKYSEAEIMAEYAIEQGVPVSQILLENQSHTTEENLRNSERIVLTDNASADPQVLIVTSDFHIFRTLLLARSLHINIHLNRGSKTASYYVPSALLREYVAVLKLHWQSSLAIYLIMLLPTIINLLNEILWA